MKVLLTRNVGIRGQTYGAGTHLELAEEDAKTLINLGKAEAETPEVVKEKPAAGTKGKNQKKSEEKSGTEEPGKNKVKEADEQHPDEQ